MKILNNRRSDGQKVGRSETATTRCPTKTLGHDKRGGFTLVELVIVIAIVIILSVVSVPIYRGYTRNAKMSEGYALLGTILSAQKAYYSQYGNFLYAANSSAGNNGATCMDEVLGIDARGNKYFSYFLVGNSEDFKSEFNAYVFIPTDLKIGNNKNLRLYYNLTSGYTYKEENF